jgi:hypothetical protein
MSLETLIAADLRKLDAEAWVASIVVEADPAKRAGEVLACAQFAAWRSAQRVRSGNLESQEEIDRQYLPRIAEVEPWKSALPRHMRSKSLAMR